MAWLKTKTFKIKKKKSEAMAVVHYTLHSNKKKHQKLPKQTFKIEADSKVPIVL